MSNDPIIEFYNYITLGQQLGNLGRPVSFSKFENITDSKCGLIQSEEYTHSSENKKNRIINFEDKTASCDNISSQQGGEYNTKQYNLKDYEENYERFKSKRKKITVQLDEESKKDLIQTLRKATGLIKDRFINLTKQENIMTGIGNMNYEEEKKVAKEENRLFTEIIVTLDEDKDDEKTNVLYKILGDMSLVLNIKEKPTTKFIIFGDIHGSYHTFYRHLRRLENYGVLDLKTLKIKDPYKLIFVGDIIDRGTYGIEILYLVLKLICANNTEDDTRIWFNKGNHEDYRVYKRYGFLKECKTKLGDSKDEFISLFNKFLVFLSSALIVKVQNKKIWICHGGIPVPSVKNKGVDPHVEGITYVNTDRAFYFLHLKEYSNQIKWNDFGPYDMLHYNQRGGDLFVIGKEYVDKFLDLNQIDWIIRAHQDHYCNGYILNRMDNLIHFIDGKETNVRHINTRDNREDIDNFLYFNKNVVLDNKVRQVNGSTCRLVATKNVIRNQYYKKFTVDCPQNNLLKVINTDKNINEENKIVCKDKMNIKLKRDTHIVNALYPEDYKYSYLPVVTISTNTDVGRDLIRDSFIVLRFDLKSSDLSDFSTSQFKN